MNSKKMGKIVTLMALATIATSASLEVVNAAETSTVTNEVKVKATNTWSDIVENKAEAVTFDLKDGKTTALDFWKQDENAKGLIRGQRYKLSAEGDGRVEIYHDNATNTTDDVVRFDDGKTMHVTEQTFKDADSLIIRAFENKDFTITFTPILDEKEEESSTESSSSESSTETSESSTESSSADSSSTETTESSKTEETTETSEEPSKYNFKFEADADGIYSIGLPTYNKDFNGDLELKVNGQVIKIKHVKVKTGSEFWVFDDNENSTKVFELKKGDVIEATSKVSVTNFSERHLIGSYSSLKNWLHTAQVYFNTENSTLEFEWNALGKKDFENIKIEKEQKIVELDGETYELKWEKGVLVSIVSTTKDKHFYNNDFAETLSQHAVFNKYNFTEEVKKMTEYKPFSLSEINALKEDKKIEQGEDLNKIMQENLKIDYTDTTLKVNYTDYIDAFFYNTETNESISKRLYTVKLPNNFKDTQVFKQNVNKLQYTTVLSKYHGGGYTMLVVYAVINEDNTMTIVTDLFGHGGKGANFFDFDLEFGISPVDEKIELPPLKVQRGSAVIEETEQVIPPKEVKKEVPKMGSNLINGTIFSTAGLAISLILALRKKFPIK